MKSKIFRPKWNYIFISISLLMLLFSLIMWNQIGSATPNPPGWKFKLFFLISTWLFTLVTTYFWATIRVGSNSIFCFFPFLLTWKKISSVEIDKNKQTVVFKSNKCRRSGFKYSLYEDSSNLLEEVELQAINNNTEVRYL